MSERRYLFISMPRLGELYAQGTGGRRVLSSVNATVPGLGGGVTFVDPDVSRARYREIERVLKHLEDDGELGTPDDPRTYFTGRVSMFIVPFEAVNPPVLYLTGQTERTVVAVAGRLEHMVGIDPGDASSRAGGRLVISEREVASVVAETQRQEDAGPGWIAPAPPRSGAERWERNIVDAHQRLTFYPSNFEERDVEVLAWRDSFTPASDLDGVLPEPMGVLLGRPVFVAY